MRTHPKHDHYFSKKPATPLTTASLQLHYFDESFTFELPSGVFSKKKLDRGTEVLLTHALIPPEASILDVGCGWGALGIILGKTYHAEVTMVDINERAVVFAKRNAKANGIKAKVFRSNLYEAVQGKQFDVILSNLPQHAGKQVYLKIIEEAPHYLKPKGSLQVVIRKNKGGNLVEEKLKEVFGSFSVLARKSGYRVYHAEKQ